MPVSVRSWIAGSLFGFLVSIPAIERAAIASSPSASTVSEQPVLGHQSVPLLTVGKLVFKDLNRNGKLDPYEDWRLAPEVRTADLLQQMTLEDLAGVMVHGTLPTSSVPGDIGVGANYDLRQTKHLIEDLHVNSFITRLHGPPRFLAEQNNIVQQLAEATRLGIPATISTDPRHHFEQVVGASVAGAAFSQWPEPLGFGAIDDPSLTRRFADIARQEYIAVGIREALSPQADLATEPRWARTNGTFGEDPEVVKRMVQAYVEGFQNGASGLGHESVITVVKHWAGYGAAKDGWDSHNYYGRFATFPGNNFEQHLVPFTGAFEAHVAAVMPTYSIVEGVTLEGKPLEPVGAGYSSQLLHGLLRGRYGFQGVILSDWGITNDCPEACRMGAPEGQKPGVASIGMSWGVGDLTKEERFAKAINAGVDQIGGTEESKYIVDAVHDGKLTEARVREAAGRVLLQKFQLGLFEQPYVDEAASELIVGRRDFVREGEAAQARAVVLLENNPSKKSRKPLLPINPDGKKVYLVNVDAAAARVAGFVVVDDPMRADLAIVRAPAPYQTEHPGYFFGSRQHEGRLNFTESDAAYAALLRLSAVVPTVFTTTLERPLILTNVKPYATALLGDFGIADGPLLALITGKAKPGGHLPFELPSSAIAVEQQKSDLPHDSAGPLYRFGYGLHY